MTSLLHTINASRVLRRRFLEKPVAIFPPYRSNLSVQQSCLITLALTQLLSSPSCHLVATHKKTKKRTGAAADNTLSAAAARVHVFNMNKCIREHLPVDQFPRRLAHPNPSIPGCLWAASQRRHGDSALSRPRDERRYESAFPRRPRTSPSESEQQLPTGP